MLNYLRLLFVLLFTILLLIGCGEQQSVEKEEEILTNEVFNTLENEDLKLYRLNKSVLAVPSSYEASALISKLNLEFNPAIPYPLDSVLNCFTVFEKAFAIGLCSVDMGYLSIYKQVGESDRCFQTILTLGASLKLRNVFDTEVIDRIEKNIDQQDSLFNILSRTFLATNVYLREYAKSDIASVILSGGWVESMHILLNTYQDTKHTVLSKRIANQKHTLSNLVKILKPYEASSKIKNLITQLVELEQVYEGIDFDYQYVKPLHDVGQKITTIRSKTTPLITSKQIDQIDNIIHTIRQDCI